MEISLIIYVDDNNLTYSPPDGQSVETIIENMAKNLLRQKRIL